MKVIIDRIEDGYAVVEIKDGETVDIPVALLPHGAKEGHVLEITLDKEETKNRQERIDKLCEDMWE